MWIIFKTHTTNRSRFHRIDRVVTLSQLYMNGTGWKRFVIRGGDDDRERKRFGTLGEDQRDCPEGYATLWDPHGLRSGQIFLNGFGRHLASC